MVKKNDNKKFKYSHWALHAVKINNMNENDAKQEAKKFIAQRAYTSPKGTIKRKVNFFRRLKSGTLSFRNIAKTKFIPRSYRSKKINENITLVYGRLKPEFANLAKMSGDGIIDDIKNFFSPRQDYNNISKATLNKYGQINIKRIFLQRTPIKEYVNKLLNIISLGQWNKSREKFHYDKLFHLQMICTLTNGKNIIIEKNDVVNIADNYQVQSDTEIYDDINIGDKILKIKPMLDETLSRIGPEKFFIYDPVKANCQVFLRDILTTQNLYNNNINEWLFQPLDEVMAEQPGWTYPISKLGTRISAVFNKLLGYGRNKKDDSYKKYVDAINKYKEHNCPSIRNKSKKELEQIANRLGINPFTPKIYDMPAFSKSKLSQKEKEAKIKKLNKLQDEYNKISYKVSKLAEKFQKAKNQFERDKIQGINMYKEEIDPKTGKIKRVLIPKPPGTFDITIGIEKMNKLNDEINKYKKYEDILKPQVDIHVKPKVDVLKDTKKLLKKIKKSKIPDMKIEKKKTEEITKKLDEFSQFVKKKKVQKLFDRLDNIIKENKLKVKPSKIEKVIETKIKEAEPKNIPKVESKIEKILGNKIKELENKKVKPKEINNIVNDINKVFVSEYTFIKDGINIATKLRNSYQDAIFGFRPAFRESQLKKYDTLFDKAKKDGSFDDFIRLMQLEQMHKNKTDLFKGNNMDYFEEFKKIIEEIKN